MDSFNEGIVRGKNGNSRGTGLELGEKHNFLTIRIPKFTASNPRLSCLR